MVKTSRGMKMSEEERGRQGVAKELLSAGDLSAKEMKKQLWERKASFVRAFDRAYSLLFSVLAILWLLPAVARWTGWGFLHLFAGLPRLGFPTFVMVIAGVFLVAAIGLDVKVNGARQEQGGCHDMHETVIIVREGPYRIVRHPGYLAEIVYFGLLPIVLSRWVPFTILAAVSVVVVVASLAYLIRTEDGFNVRKWGDEYRHYMKKVPAVNFVRGLKRLGKKDE